MLRWWLMLLAVVVIPACGAPARSQESNWTAWLRFGRTLVLVDSEGNTRREVELPLVENYAWDPTASPVFSADGTQVFYRLLTLDGHAPQTVVYHTQTNIIQQTDEAEENGADSKLYSAVFLPTGDAVMLGSHDGRFYHHLVIYDPIKHARYPFFSITQPSADLHFVQNGERILNQQSYPNGTHWLLIERDGRQAAERNLQSIVNRMSITSLEGTPDGFIYTASVTMPGAAKAMMVPALMEVNTRESLSEERIIWLPEVGQIPAIVRDGLHIEWVGYDAPLGPYQPWAQLAEPVYDTPAETAVILPTFLPPAEPIFRVGMMVKVQTIDGEILYLRGAPSRKATILLHIKDETRLTLLDGPHPAEGLTWWRVQTPDGAEGWAVENTGDLQTLFPL